MAIIVEELTAVQRDTLLAQSEGHFLDFKAKEVKPSSLTKALSAFANADGGELFVGIAQVGPERRNVWDGFANQEAANGHVQAFESFFPLGKDVLYEFLKAPSAQGLVLHIQLLKTQVIRRASDGVAYIRRGAQKIPVRTVEEQRQLEYSKGIASFETELTAAPVAAVANSAAVIEFMLQVIPTAEPENWLRKQQLIRDANATVAGVLLFADEPPVFLPKRSGVKITRYKTSEAQGFREALAFTPMTVEGPLLDQITAAVQKTVEVVQEIPRLGDTRLEPVVYPREAIHEIVTNALLHRDYSMTDDVHIRIFDNRIEVESPGKLPGHITVKNILDERFARNAVLVRLLNKYPNPPNKDVGEGLNTAFNAMVNLGLKEPIIEERENSVRVVIRHEPLASPEETLLAYLAEHGSIRNAKAREICHIKQDHQMQRIFQRLVERDIIEKVPGTQTRSTAYRLKGSGGMPDSNS